MPFHRAAIAFGLFCAASIPASVATPLQLASGIFEERACDIPTANPEVASRLRCGIVRVPRNSQAPESGEFELAVVVRKSVRPLAGALPLLVLHGGPGDEMTRYMGQSTGDYVDGRDTIAFDMRGGGRSTPRDCSNLPFALQAPLLRGLESDALVAARREAIAGCVAERDASGMSAAEFSTARNVEDAEAIRQALGIERWAVFGMSYGTTVAADYSARYPQALESVALDSLYPPDELLLSVRDSQALLFQRLAAECKGDPACHAAFPTFSAEQAGDALIAASTAPLAFTFSGTEHRANEAMLRATVHGLSLTEAGARSIPWFIDAVARQQGREIAGVLSLPYITAVGSDGLSIAAALATDCRDRARHHLMRTDGGPGYLELLLGIPDGACKGFGEAGEGPRLPEASTVPTLIFAGGYDAFQPNAEAVAARIGPAAQLVSIPFASHVARGAGACPRALLTTWVNAPTQPLDTTCIASMPAPAFLTSAYPLPALVSVGAALQSGAPPAGVLALLVGALDVLLLGLALPTLLVVFQRFGKENSTLQGLPRWHLATTVTTLAAVFGLVAAAAWTAMNTPAVAAFGLTREASVVLWLQLPALLVAAITLLRAVRERRVVTVALASGALLALGALSWLGLSPWAS